VCAAVAAFDTRFNLSGKVDGKQIVKDCACVYVHVFMCVCVCVCVCVCFTSVSMMEL
jgi:hypothetical protein